MTTLNPLPLGTISFPRLRKNREVYVDKTDLLYPLLADGRGKFFLARPRRFGKSLLLSTIATLFESGVKHFDGLKIAPLWTEKTFPVVSLDFSLVRDFDDFSTFLKLFESNILCQFARLGFVYDKNDILTASGALAQWLKECDNNDALFVLLIDEYDAPLTHAMLQTELFERVHSFLSQFFLAIKAGEGALRFFMMTGISKFANLGIFSGFNIITDLSLTHSYATLLGYTTEDLQTYFGKHLKRAAQLWSCSQDELLQRLRAHYNGFCFDPLGQDSVYCPWSVLNVLKFPDFGLKNYWYHSAGQPTLLMRSLSKNSLDSLRFLSQGHCFKCDIQDLHSSQRLDQMDPVLILLCAGYLTIQHVSAQGIVSLGIPNQEVADSLPSLLSDVVFARGRESSLSAQDRTQLMSLSESLATADVDALMGQFNIGFLALDYANYPIRDEASCRAFVQIMLLMAKLHPRVEVHNALGRSDIELTHAGLHWVFELKFAREGDSIESLLTQALEQIRTKRYGLSEAAGKTHLAVGAVFSQSQRQFVAWSRL